MSAIVQLEVQDAAHQARDKELLHHAAAEASRLSQGSTYISGVAGLNLLVCSAEAALKNGDLKLCRSLLDAYFAEAERFHGPQAKVEAKDQLMCRALFAAGQLVSRLSSSFKGQALVDGVLESVRYIMQGVDLASSNPRYSYLIYNGSVHHWHAARPLQCEQLRQHLLPSLEKLCQALEKVDGQSAWKVRQLMALALCQSEGPKPDEATKTLTKAVDMAGAAELLDLKHEVAALQTHVQSQQAAKLAAGKAPAAGPAGKAPAGAAAGTAAAKGSAAPGLAAAARRRSGELANLQDKLDEGGALSILQWVMSTRPGAAAAEQQIKTAWKMVDPRPEGPSRNALLRVVARLAWAAALSGATQLAEQMAKRAAASPDLGPRVWSDLTRLLLVLQAAPPATLNPGDSAGYGSTCSPETLQTRLKVLEGVDEAVTNFLKLQDVDGVHYCSKLAWNAGLPLLQQQHRHLLKPCFAAVAKALEATSSPLARLRTALHLEVAKAEADGESYSKAAKEVALALSLNYPPSAEAAAIWGYERSLDRFLQPLARAARLRGGGIAMESDGKIAAAVDDDAVVLLERARESKSGAIRGDYLQKAIDKLALLPAVKPPPALASGATLDAAALAARADQLRAARSRTELWAEIVQLAWMPCELEAVVRTAAPYVLAVNHQDTGDKEMMLLQSRVAFLEADACRAALKKLDVDPVPPAGYNAAQHQQPTATAANNTEDLELDFGPGAADLNEHDIRLPSTTEDQLQRLLVEDLLAGMKLAVAAGQPWVLMNGALAAWNAYVPLMQKQRYAELAGVLLRVLKQLLQEQGQLDPNLCVMLAEAAAKAAEHVALLQVLQPPPAEDESDSEGDEDNPSWQLWGFRAGDTPWFVPLMEARAKTADLEVAKLLQAGSTPVYKDLLQLLSETSDACQAALAKATTAAEPQGLIQSYARLQQLQGKAVAVPPGAPASMAVTSKVLALIEGLTAASAGANGAAGGAGSAAGVGTAGAKPVSAGKPPEKPIAAAPTANKVEQDIRTAMQLLASAPAVNLELWSQLSRAAGRQGFWQLAKECAVSALGALPAEKRSLAAVNVADDVPDVSPQGWYWLSVAEMQQGQAVMSLLWSGVQDAATQLSLQHKALTNFATAAKLASFIGRADLAEAAARLAWNACTANGGAGLLGTALTRAAAIPQLKTVCAALNATRPADPSFQVSCNILLLECLSAAGHWPAARQHVDSLQRNLALKSHGPAAAAAVAVAGWRATCLARAPPSKRMMEDMNRLLSELSTRQARAHAWLAFGQACSSLNEQLNARKGAVSALDGFPIEQVEYQIEFAEWLLASNCDASTAGTTADALLQTAINSLRDVEAAAAEDDAASVSEADETASRYSATSKRRASQSPDRSTDSRRRVTVQSAVKDPANQGRRTGTASVISAKGAGQRVGRSAGGKHGKHGRDSPEGPKHQVGLSLKQMDQLVRAYNLLAQVAPSPSERTDGLLHAQQYATRMLTTVLSAAGAAPNTTALSSNASEATAEASSSADAGDAPPAAAEASTSQQTLPETFPNNQQKLDWARWKPSPELLTQLQSSAGTSGPMQLSPLARQHKAHSASGAADPAVGQLNHAAVHVPELTMANLTWLAEELQAAGQHVAALPVLQLARMVATVV